MPRRMSLQLTLASLTALVLLAATPAAADYGPRLGVSELADVSAVVVRGRVYSVDSAWDVAAGNIYTYVRIDVAEALGGGYVPGRIILKQLGGVVGQVGQYVGGQAAFRPGERVVVFLEVRPRDATVYTTGLWQGKWTVSGEPGSELLHRDAGPEADGGELLPESVPLAAVRDAIHAVVRPRARAARSIRFRPPEAPAPANTVDRGAAQRIPFLGFSWHEAFSGQTVPFNFFRSRQTGVGSGRRQLRDAIAAWTDVPRTLPVERLGGRRGGTAPGTALRSAQGVQDLLLQNNDPNGEISDSGAILAVGGAWYFISIEIRALARGTNGYVVMNDSATAAPFLQDRTCYQNVLTHEVGHTLGLDHSSNSSSIMYPTVSRTVCSAGSMQLGREDKRFYRKIYKRAYAGQ